MIASTPIAIYFLLFEFLQMYFVPYNIFVNLIQREIERSVIIFQMNLLMYLLFSTIFFH